MTDQELLESIPRSVWYTPRQIAHLARLNRKPIPYELIRRLAYKGELIRQVEKGADGRKKVRYVRP